MTERHKTKKHIRIIIITILALLVIGYTLYEIQRIVSGPKITILLPQNRSVVSTSSLEIMGQAENIADISLDDRNIFIDEKGDFQEEVLLSPGYNVITLKADDRFGNKTEKTLEVIYQ